MDAHKRRLVAQFPELVSVRPLGQSSGGRAIDLVSIGSGSRSALIVGAPHPNEPIGCLTALRLMDRLVEDETLRDRLGFTCHFITAIDPDGIALNEGWFSRPGCLSTYLRNFFRPAFADQPEYTFPLETDHYSFNEATPENLCWQRALAMTRPDFQSSLHGADLGGVFYILSEARPELAEALTKVADSAGLPLNYAGEPLAELPPIAPGVFQFPQLARMLENAAARSMSPGLVWGAGDSSAAFAARHYGTLSMTCEVPLWNDRRLADSSLSNHTLAEILGLHLGENAEIMSLVKPAVADFKAIAETSPERAILRSLDEAIATAARQARQIGPAVSTNPQWAQPLPVNTHASIDGTMRLARWRALGMLTHLADLTIDNVAVTKASRDAGARAADLIDRKLERLDTDASIKPIPLAVSSDVQMASILETLEHWAGAAASHAKE